jgi:regulator of protease activity HflC (stomatin/prohibitin superfamily)
LFWQSVSRIPSTNGSKTLSKSKGENKMTNGAKKFITALILLAVCLVGGIIIYAATHETIPAGYVGYVYDRTATPEDNVIEGTSVIDNERTGRITVNPVTQDVLRYPTTIISENWTRLAEGDNKVDMSMSIASKEGKNIDADVYISVRPIDIGKIIKSFGTKSFDSIINNDIYGLSKGKLNGVTQEYSVYDVQASRTEIQQKVSDVLKTVLYDIYGVELIRFELGTLILPEDIQLKIDQKTEAQNEVELAKLEREKQDEINQQIVDQQKAQSQKELLQRQAEADAAAYEVAKEAQAQIDAQKAKAEVAQIKRDEAEAEQRSRVEIAKMQVEEAELMKKAELENQETLTDKYFRDRELDIQEAAVKAINGSVKTIITSGDGEGYGGLFGIKEILDSVGE